MTSSRNKHKVVLTAVSLLLILGSSVCWFELWRPEAPANMRVEGQISIDGGSPTQRARIDDYTDRVGEEDFEMLVRNLNKHEDLLVRIGARFSDPVPEFMFEACVANRRIAKLFEELEAQRPQEADRACRQIFSEKMRLHKESITEVLDLWEASSPPSTPRPLFANCTALSGAVFLSANFCPLAETLRQVDQWEDFGRTVEQRIEANPDTLSAELAMYAGPQSRFLLNLYAWMLAERGAADAVANLELKHSLESKRALFCAWNAHTNPFDFTHQSRHVPVDQSRVLREVTLYDWRAAPLSFVRQQKEQTLSALRQTLEGYARR